jgi:SPP1 gp7 family putative phage head morphogenesis protein
MGAVFQQAEAELSRDLARWLRTVENGAERFTAQRLRVALVQMRGAMRRLRGTSDALFDVLSDVNARSGPLAMGHLARQVERFSMLFEGSIRPLPIAPAAVIARGDRLLLRQFKASAARYGDWAVTEIQRQLAVGVVRGETFHELTKRLQRLSPTARNVAGMVQGAGQTADDIARALTQRIRNRAELIVRTEATNAYNAHAHDGLVEAVAEDPDFLMRWDAANDSRLCPLCRELDGKTAPVDGDFGRGVKHPPLHPNCRCALTPWHKAWGESPRIGAPAPRFSDPKPVEPEGLSGKGWSASKLAADMGSSDPSRAAPMLAKVLEDVNDVGMPSRLKTIARVPDLPAGTWGDMSFTGRMRLKPDLFDGARGALETLGRGGQVNGAGADTLRALLHEATHACSAILPSAYRGIGVLVEEVTTEVAARRAAGKLLGRAVKYGSYGTWVDAVVEAVSRAGGVAQAEAYALVEEASLAMRRRGALVCDTPELLAANFSVRVFPHDQKARFMLLDLMGKIR